MLNWNCMKHLLRSCAQKGENGTKPFNNLQQLNAAVTAFQGSLHGLLECYIRLNAEIITT